MPPTIDASSKSDLVTCDRDCILAEVRFAQHVSDVLSCSCLGQASVVSDVGFRAGPPDTDFYVDGT